MSQKNHHCHLCPSALQSSVEVLRPNSSCVNALMWTVLLNSRHICFQPSLSITLSVSCKAALL